MSESDQLLFVREFLNKPGYESTGFIFIEVSEGDTWPTVQIGDCNRQITLSFSVATEQSSVNSHYKLDLLIDSLQKFKKALVKVERNAKKRRKERETRPARPTRALAEALASMHDEPMPAPTRRHRRPRRTT